MEPQSYMVDNFRPPQPLNGRIVSASFQEYFSWTEYYFKELQEERAKAKPEKTDCSSVK